MILTKIKTLYLTSDLQLFSVFYNHDKMSRAVIR